MPAKPVRPRTRFSPHACEGSGATTSGRNSSLRSVEFDPTSQRLCKGARDAVLQSLQQVVHVFDAISSQAEIADGLSGRGRKRHQGLVGMHAHMNALPKGYLSGRTPVCAGPQFKTILSPRAMLVFWLNLPLHALRLLPAASALGIFIVSVNPVGFPYPCLSHCWPLWRTGRFSCARSSILS